ncbi:MAG: HAD-IA family hydrolase [Bermanella sp.]|jgi:haloacid dehalogenase superfamily, subfamily IA, variant 3 with third motif having DD or ED/haloacid dehalogenase superfamily, subfamily IA, variant 1 with third motif having Dx(3-4)D or Dx(3-4)E
MNNQPTTTANKFHGVLFDLDGTLVDTADDFIYCLNRMRQQEGLPPLAAQAIRTVVSDGARAMITLAFKLQEGDAGFAEKKQQFLQLYSQNLATASDLFASLRELINWCQQQNIPWGIVTNKPRQYSAPLLKALKLHEGIATLVCADDVSHPKPDPEPMYKACDEMALAASDCLYVGDHARDIQAGKNAGMHTIAAAYGYVHHASEARQWQADWTVTSSNALSQQLKTLLHPKASH